MSDRNMVPSPLELLAGMVDDGKVLLESWVFQDEVRSYRVICRGRDGWRKSADAKTLVAAIQQADEAAWHQQPDLPDADDHGVDVPGEGK